MVGGASLVAEMKEMKEMEPPDNIHRSLFDSTAGGVFRPSGAIWAAALRLFYGRFTKPTRVFGPIVGIPEGQLVISR